MHASGLHLCQEFIHLLGFRHKVCLPQKASLSRNRIFPIHYRQQVLGIEQANNIIDGVFIDWHARVPGFDEFVACVADGGVHLQRQDVHAWYHDIFRHGFTEAENGIDHLTLTLFERALGLLILHPVPEGIIGYGQGHFLSMLAKH